MSRQCELSGKTSMMGNRVSHANNKTRVRLLSNLQDKRLFSVKLNRFIRLRVSTSAMRTVNKLGLDAYAAAMGVKLK